MDGLPVDLGSELRVGVEVRLGGAPVVTGAPVGGQVLQVAQRYAAFPPGAGQAGRPSCIAEPVLQVVDVGLWDLDAEGSDLVVHRASPFSWVIRRRLRTIEERIVPRLSARIEEC